MPILNVHLKRFTTNIRLSPHHYQTPTREFNNEYQISTFAIAHLL